MPERPIEPMGYDRLELPYIWVPDGCEPPPLPWSKAVAFRAMWIPDDYQGPPPGYPWIEVGRMALPPKSKSAGARANRAASSNGITAAGATVAGTGQRTDAPGPDAAAASAPGDVIGQFVGDARTAGAGDDRAAAARAWLAGCMYPDVGATMKAWNALSDPRVTLTALDALSGSTPVVKSLAREAGGGNGFVQGARYAPSGAAPLPLPPVFLTGTPENEAFVNSTIQAGKAIVEAIGNFLNSEQPNESAGDTPSAGSLKQASTSDLQAAAKADGY